MTLLLLFEVFLPFKPFLVQIDGQMGWNIHICDIRQNGGYIAFPDVNQHVRVRESLLHAILAGYDIISTKIASIVVLVDVLFRHRDHPIVIKLEPLAIGLWLQERAVVASMNVSNMYKHAARVSRYSSQLVSYPCNRYFCLIDLSALSDKNSVRSISLGYS